MPSRARYKRILDSGRRVAVPWYLAGGVPLVNCLGAYNAKGATDLASSYTDLTGHGKTLSVLVGSPVWDTVNGWKPAGGVALDTGIDLTCWNSGNPLSSAVIRFTTYNTAGSGLFGFFVGTHSKFYFRDEGVTFYGFANGDVATSDVPFASNLAGVAIVHGKKLNWNGVDAGGTVASGTNGTYRCLLLAMGNGAGGVSAFGYAYVQNAAFYDINLTVPQCAAIYAAVSVL